MIRCLPRERRIVNRDIRNQAGGPTKNAIERQHRPSRWKARDRRGDAKCRFKNTEGGPTAAAPFVEIAKQNCLHWRQALESRQKCVGLVHS